jgi:hypothetical protein
MANCEPQNVVVGTTVKSASETVVSRTVIFAAIPHGSSGKFPLVELLIPSANSYLAAFLPDSSTR